MSEETVNQFCKSGTPVATYVWPWGETGVCDAEGQIILGQKARALKRQVVVTPLVPGAPPPIERAERIETQAKILALELECDEAKSRGLDLYHDIERLQEQLRLETAKCQSVSASLERAILEVDQLRVENGKLRQQAARENDELQRLRAFVSPSPTQPPPALGSPLPDEG
jgi:hypothetical protein